MFGHFMTAWHLNTWPSQEQKELSKWNKKHFSLFDKHSPLELQKKLVKIKGTQPLTSFMALVSFYNLWKHLKML